MRDEAGPVRGSVEMQLPENVDIVEAVEAAAAVKQGGV